MDFSIEDEVYQKQLIGEFFVEFDQLISTLPFLIPKLVFNQDMNGLVKSNIETLICSFTASQLLSVYDSLLKDNIEPLVPELIKMNNALSKETVRLVEIRNEFAHGAYRIGWKNFEGELDKGTFSLRFSKATKRGFEKRSRIYAIKSLSEIIKKMRLLKDAYLRIASILSLYYSGQSILEQLENLESIIKSIGTVEFKSIDEIN